MKIFSFRNLSKDKMTAAQLSNCKLDSDILSSRSSFVVTLFNIDIKTLKTIPSFQFFLDLRSLKLEKQT